MKRIISVILLSLAMVISFALPLLAEEAKEDKVSTLLILKNDWIMPESGEAFDMQRLSAYWHYKQLGGGLDVNYIRHSDYIQVKPYLTLNNGPWYMVGGFAADNFSQYAQFGFWHIDTYGKFNVILDVRNYFGVGGAAASYMDNFLEVTYPLGEKFYVGADAIYDHWWSGNHNWFLIGPVVGYRLTKEVSLFARVSRDWDMNDGVTKGNNCVRLGVMFSF